MDTETIAIVSVVFGTPVAIVTIVCIYNLLKHWIDKRAPQQSPPAVVKAGPMSTENLSSRAADLQRRLNNLEEILRSEKQNGGTA